MIYLVIILAIIILGFAVYLIMLKKQIHRINELLEKRVRERTEQFVSLDMINKELNRLSKNINVCLKAEENLRLEKIREENKFREMIVNISHDLRTPLTAVKGYLQLLDKEELKEEQKYKLGIAMKHTNELGNLIEHFFEYAYLLNHEPEIHLERINLNNLVIENVISSSVVLEEKKLGVDYKDSEPVFVLGDIEVLTRIIQNLIQNCARYAVQNIIIRIESGERAVLSFINQVSDPGKINTENLFDRFYTGDSSRRHSTGLGLSIVKLLTEQLGGMVGTCIEGDMLKISIELPIYN